MLDFDGKVEIDEAIVTIAVISLISWTVPRSREYEGLLFKKTHSPRPNDADAGCLCV